MIKTLTRHGNSLALVIDKPVLELLNINVETQLNVSTDGQSLIVSPVKDADEEARFAAALAKVNRKYGKVLKRLAN